MKLSKLSEMFSMYFGKRFTQQKSSKTEYWSVNITTVYMKHFSRILRELLVLILMEPSYTFDRTLTSF